MVHFVGDDLRGWLLGYGLVALVGVAAWAQRNLRIRQFTDEERDVPLAPDGPALVPGALAVAVAGLVGVVVNIASSVPLWNQILRYARGEPTGTDRSGRVSRTERSG